MNIETHQHGSVSVLAPRGPLASGDCQSFATKAHGAVQQRAGRVVIDLREVPFVDGAGIEALLALSETGPGAATPRLAGLSDTVREALDLTDALPRLMVFDTVESAIRSLKD